jgi:Fe-S cluster biogenesis protein NfuA
MNQDVQISAEPTPNPRTMKFVADRSIADGSADIRSSEESKRSPLAAKLFGFPWVESIFVGPNFVAITKQDWVDWEILAQPLIGLIKEHLDEGGSVLLPEVQSDSGTIADDDSPVVRRIKEIIDNEIRPAVAMDGGDIVFQKYQDNRVHLLMRGACSGCPSSAMTLKMGIETRLKEAIPEIIEVVAD